MVFRTSRYPRHCRSLPLRCPYVNFRVYQVLHGQLCSCLRGIPLPCGLPRVSSRFEIYSPFNSMCGACYPPEPCLRPPRLRVLRPQQGRPARFRRLLSRSKGERGRHLQRPTSRGNEVWVPSVWVLLFYLLLFTSVICAWYTMGRSLAPLPSERSLQAAPLNINQESLQSCAIAVLSLR